MAKALMLGFGGSGAQTLTFEKEISVWKEGRAPEHVSFLLFDTIKGWKAGRTVQILGGRGTEKLAESRDKAANLDDATEYYHLTDRDPDLNRQVSNVALPAHLTNWLHTQWLALHVPEAARNIEEGAAQQRQIGRFAVFQNAGYVRRKLAEIFQRTRATNVWLVASAAGGTGAGGLLDAALLVRLAARDANIDPKITGVVVLPDVYADKPGISKGRAYGLFRELERFQESGFDAAEDAFRAGSENLTVKIQYDSAGQIVATRGLGGLFDYLFYVGEPCRNDGERESFFSSVANAIDPYLDEVAGPRLLQASVNQAGKLPSSFGASRVYLPVQTLAELYSWEEVQSYIEEITAPVIDQHRVVDVAAGAAADRRKEATEAFARFLPLFGLLNKVFDDGSSKWGQNNLSSSSVRLVEEHLQFANPQAAGFSLSGDDSRLVKLTYRNPYVSLTEAEENLPPEQRRLRTHADARRGGQKENLEESRQRFQREIESFTGLYRNEQGGESSMVRGLEVIRLKLTERLRARVDEMIIGAFDGAPGIGKRGGTEGTVLTRQYKILEEILADNGPVSNVKAVLGAMRVFAEDQERRVSQRLQQVLTDLKEWRPNPWWMLGFLTNASGLTSAQTEAAAVAGDAARAFQVFKLVQVIDELMQITEERLAAWRTQLRDMLNGLALSPATTSAFGHARGAIDELNTRLQRQVNNPLAIVDPISAISSTAGDPGLHGYRARLKQETTTVPGSGMTLAADRVSQSRWRAEVDQSHRPRLLLEVAGTSFDGATVTTFAPELARNFRFSVDRELAAKDIFDYLLHCQASGNVTPKEIGKLLDARAHALINLSVPDETFLTYATPRPPVADLPAHVNYGQAISGGLPSLSAYYDHSDRFSICLLKVKKPADTRQIQDIRDCLQDYLRYQTQQLINVQVTDDELRRAEVFHVFRAELEAWYLEREAFIKRGIQASSENHIPPRIARLLDNPARMLAFVKCLATGAIVQEESDWWWIDPRNQKIRLNDPTEGNSTIVRAAVNFVLRGEEGAFAGIRPISLEDAQRSSATAAAQKNKSEADLLREFTEPQRLNDFLDKAFPNFRLSPNYPRERHGLEMILNFYATPGVSIGLVQRMLPS